MSRLLRSCMSPVVILGAIGVAILIVIAIVGLAVFSRPFPGTSRPPEAALTVLPAPTATIAGLPSPQASQAEALQTPPEPGEGVIELEATVQIWGTSGEGLNLRETPGLNGNILYLGIESEVFIVKDGPNQADGLNWWYLEGFYDSSRRGWAAANYLAVIQNP